MDVLNGIIHVHELEIFRYVNQGVKTVNHDYQTIKRRLDEIKTRGSSNRKSRLSKLGANMKTNTYKLTLKE